MAFVVFGKIIVLSQVVYWLQPIRSSDNDSTGFWAPGSLHTLGADGHI